jgi:hypothetical protein
MSDGALMGIPISAGGTQPIPLVMLDSTGAILRTLAHVDPPLATVRATFSDNQSVQLGAALAAHPLWLSEANARSIVIVNRPVAARAGDAVFEIVRIGVAGDTLMHRRVNYTAIAVDDAVADRIFSDYGRRFAARFSITPAQAERSVRQVLALPRFQPPVSELVTGRDGTIWLRREDLRTDSVEWHMFDAQGALRGSVTLPAALKLHRAQADRLWSVVRDSQDVPFVQVWAIRPGD